MVHDSYTEIEKLRYTGVITVEDAEIVHAMHKIISVERNKIRDAETLIMAATSKINEIKRIRNV